jgi:hypothetical protein
MTLAPILTRHPVYMLALLVVYIREILVSLMLVLLLRPTLLLAAELDEGWLKRWELRELREQQARREQLKRRPEHFQLRKGQCH